MQPTDLIPQPGDVPATGRNGRAESEMLHVQRGDLQRVHTAGGEEEQPGADININ